MLTLTLADVFRLGEPGRSSLTMSVAGGAPDTAPRGSTFERGGATAGALLTCRDDVNHEVSRRFVSSAIAFGDCIVSEK